MISRAMEIAGPIARKLMTVFAVLLGVSLLTFLISNVLPGSAAQQLLGVDGLRDGLGFIRTARGTRRRAAL